MVYLRLLRATAIEASALRTARALLVEGLGGGELYAAVSANVGATGFAEARAMRREISAVVALAGIMGLVSTYTRMGHGYSIHEFYAVFKLFPG